MKSATLVLCLLIASPTFAQVYRCPDAKNRVVIQQTPCVGGSKLNVRPASGDAPASGDVTTEPTQTKPATEAERINARTEASQRERRKTELENRAVPDADMALAAARRECIAQTEELEGQRGTAKNNLAGATYLQSIATQMQALAMRCDTRERVLRDDYDRLLRECKGLGGCSIIVR